MLHDIFTYTPMYVTLFWAVVLLSGHRQNNLAKHFLGVFMVVAFVLYLSHAVFFNRRLGIYPLFDVLYVMSSLSVYPLYFWYIRLLTVDTTLKMKNLWMLIPAFILGIVTAAIYLLMTPGERMQYINHYLLHEMPAQEESLLIIMQKWVFYTSRIIFVIQVIFSVIYGTMFVIRYNNRVSNFYSDLENKTILWVNLLLISFVITSFMSITFNIIGKAVFFERQWLLMIPSLIFSVLLFWIGLQGYMQNHTVKDLVNDENQNEITDIKKYNNEKLREKLLELFEKEKLYRQSDLKITDLSEKLKTNRTYISNLINTEFSSTFSDFVNQYRIKDAKQLLTAKNSRVYSLEFIAEKAGFGSLSSFIRVFRETEGITPGKFRDRSKIESVNQQT